MIIDPQRNRERNDRIIEMISAKNRTYTEIAKAMGLTRNVVAGVAARAHVARGERVLKRNRDRYSGVGKSSGFNIRSGDLSRIAAPFEFAGDVKTRKYSETDGAALEDLRSGDCRWPIFPNWTARKPAHVPTRFCAEPADIGKSYCPAHCAIGYEKPREPISKLIKYLERLR